MKQKKTKQKCTECVLLPIKVAFLAFHFSGSKKTIPPKNCKPSKIYAASCKCGEIMSHTPHLTPKITNPAPPPPGVRATRQLPAK